MFKLYNPFKPHVVKFSNGKYGLRKLNLFGGYEFFGQKHCNYWWHDMEYIPEYCTVDNIEDLRKPIGNGEYVE